MHQGDQDRLTLGSIAKAVESVEKLLASDVHTALLPGVVTRMPRVVMRCQAGGDGAPDPPVEAASRQTARGFVACEYMVYGTCT